MQTLANTEYQDLYRVTDGVLLVVNKFKLQLNSKGLPCTYVYSNAKRKSYHKGCQKQLQVLGSDWTNYDETVTLKKGDVIYCSYPVKLVPQDEWEYQIKTTGDLFKGNAENMQQMLSDILTVVCQDSQNKN